MMKKKRTIIALEQALALPYATQRFVQLGWRVIRIETPAEGDENAGDPNRYIGADLGYHDLHSYYIAPNAGKEAITLNLKHPEGKELLLKLIKELDADVFMCNTLPKRYAQLGIDFQTLKTAKADLIWCGISAMGPAYPDRAGYDPALQAMTGFTFLTGEPNGMPVPCGIPILDLKAGDEAYTQVLLAMLEANPQGKEIHISMAQCAASWLITALPQLNFVQSDSELFSRSGNEHRSFIPSNVYATKDGFVYLAIGNDSQWAKFADYQGFEGLKKEIRRTNAGRMIEKEAIYSEIESLTKNYLTSDFVDLCLKMNLAVAPVNTIRQVAELELVKSSSMLTTLPDGKQARLSPPSYSSDYMVEQDHNMGPAPRLGEQNSKVYAEIGLTEVQLNQFIEGHII